MGDCFTFTEESVVKVLSSKLAISFKEERFARSHNKRVTEQIKSNGALV